MLIKKYIKSYAVIAVVSVMLLNPQLFIQSIKNGMIICYESVIPSLYIFMIISNYRAQPDIMEVLSFPFRWYGRLMKADDKYYSGSLTVSLLGGFAVGAEYINILKQRNYSTNAIKVLSVSLINNSFAFCVFAVGTIYLGNTLTGLIIYVSLVSASMITAFILSFIINYNIVSSIGNENANKISIVNSIKKAVENMMVICGFVIVFHLLCEVIALYTINNQFISLFLSIILEITCGILKIISILGKDIYFICFALSVLPVSTLCQVYYFTEDFNIIKTLLLSRFIHTPFSLLIVSVLKHLFPSAMIVSSNVIPMVSAVSDSMEISSSLFMITVVFLMIFDKNKLFTKHR